VIRSGPSVCQTNHALLCRLLRKILIDGAQAGCDADGGIRSVQFRASAALYALLLAHPLDQQGCFRSCPSPSAVFGYRRRCWVHRQTSYWLRQPADFLHSRLANEWGLAAPSLPSVALRPTGTTAAGRPIRMALTRCPRSRPPIQPLQTPVVPSTPPLRWDDRISITAGPGMIPMASGLAVFHPRTHTRSSRVGRRCSPEA
jgi:hypothetical protein